MRRASVIWGVAAVAAGGAIVLLAALPHLAAGRVAGALAARLLADTGLKLSLEGAATASWLPRPTVRMTAVAVGPETGAVVARADSVDVELSWPGLWRGRLDVARLNLQRVTAPLLPSMVPLAVEARAEGVETRIAATSDAGTAQLVVRREAGTIHFDALTLRSGAFAASGEGRLLVDDPTRLVLRFDRITRDSVSVGSAAFAGSYARDGVLLERATFRRPDGAEISLFGHAVMDRGSLRLEGGVEAGAPAAEAAARLDGVIENGVLQLDIADIDARAGGGRLTGTASLTSGARSRVAADLRIDRMDIAAATDVLRAVAIPLAIADEAELRLRAGRLSIGASGAEGVIIDIAGRDGGYDLRELAIRDLGGAPLRAVGHFTRHAEAMIGVDKLALRYGAVEGGGRVDIDLSGERPRIKAELATAPLMLEPVFSIPPPLPPEPLTRRAAAAAAAARQNPTPAGWSRESFTLPFLPPVDAEIAITTPRLTLRSQRLDNVRIAMRLGSDGVDLDELSGATYGGQLSAKGRLDPTSPPGFRGTVQLAGADLRAMMQELAGVDALTGRADIVADLAAAGGSAAELIRTLAGEVRLSARDGVLSGFDLPAVGERLRRINRPTDLIELARAGSGGRTPFSTLDGKFQITRGAARTEGIRLVARGGEARLRGTIDLPAWTLDLVNELAVTDPPGLPPLALKLNGSIAAPRSVFDIAALQSELMRRFKVPR